MQASYTLPQVAAAVGVCTGCAMFALADARQSNNTASAMGIALLSIAVAADACTANTQEALLVRYRIPAPRMVLQQTRLPLSSSRPTGASLQRCRRVHAAAHVLGQRRAGGCYSCNRG